MCRAQIGGRGVFEWHPALLSWYYQLGGAKIGKGVSIHPKALLSDFDLITIGDGACIDAALVCTSEHFTVIVRLLHMVTCTYYW